MGSRAKRLEEEVASWTQVSVSPHRFGGREFRFGKAEIGHVHFWADVDIPFPRTVHDVLLEEGLAQRHRWLPESGWITFHMSSDDDLKRAIWLLRLSYLRYALKSSPEPERILHQEAERLKLSPQFTSLLARFMLARAGA